MQDHETFCTKCNRLNQDKQSVAQNRFLSEMKNKQESTFRPPITYDPDTVSAGLMILSLLIPLFGIIYYFVKSNDCPNKAKACIVNSLFAIVQGIVSVIYVFSAVGSLL